MSCETSRGEAGMKKKQQYERNLSRLHEVVDGMAHLEQMFDT